MALRELGGEESVGRLISPAPPIGCFVDTGWFVSLAFGAQAWVPSCCLDGAFATFHSLHAKSGESMYTHVHLHALASFCLHLDRMG